MHSLVPAYDRIKCSSKYNLEKELLLYMHITCRLGTTQDFDVAMKTLTYIEA